MRTSRSDEQQDDKDGRVLACASCSARITTNDARVEVAGAHAHTFANPDGLSFRLGCFSDAAGIALVGPRTTYFTWFAGYSWQVALCAACGEQLGWLYRSVARSFHGLILDRLRELEE